MMRLCFGNPWAFVDAVVVGVVRRFSFEQPVRKCGHFDLTGAVKSFLKARAMGVFGEVCFWQLRDDREMTERVIIGCIGRHASSFWYDAISNCIKLCIK